MNHRQLITHLGITPQLPSGRSRNKCPTALHLSGSDNGRHRLRHAMWHSETKDQHLAINIFLTPVVVVVVAVTRKQLIQIGRPLTTGHLANHLPPRSPVLQLRQRVTCLLIVKVTPGIILINSNTSFCFFVFFGAAREIARFRFTFLQLRRRQIWRSVAPVSTRSQAAQKSVCRVPTTPAGVVKISSDKFFAFRHPVVVVQFSVWWRFRWAKLG